MRVLVKLYGYKIIVDPNGDHSLFAEWCPLGELVNDIDIYDRSSINYHEKVKRARERLYKRFGECNFG